MSEDAKQIQGRSSDPCLVTIKQLTSSNTSINTGHTTKISLQRDSAHIDMIDERAKKA